MSAPIIKGITTISWGTTGTLPNSLNTAIVKSVKHTTLGGDPIIIEDNPGFAAVWVLIVDGDMLEINCVDDSAITWPQKGDTVAFIVPGQANAQNFIIDDNNAGTERRREGERTLKAEYRPGITF